MDDESRKLCKLMTLARVNRGRTRSVLLLVNTFMVALPTNTPSIVCPPQASSAVITTIELMAITP